MLSEILKDHIEKDDKAHTLILGIPRGGILTADVVSKRLGITNFDMVIPRKLTDPENKEQAIGGIIDSDTIFILRDSQGYFQSSQEYLTSEISVQLGEIKRREKEYTQNFPREFLFKKIKDSRVIILIDDGLATGATMTVTLQWIRRFCMAKALGEKRLIVAAPVIPKSIAEQLVNEHGVKIASVLLPPSTSFRSVEQYYEDFAQVTDEQVVKILEAQ